MEMLVAIFRTLGAIVAAMLVALLLVIAVEIFSSVVHPVPADFDGTMAQMCQHVERYPQWVLAVVVLFWAGIALVSTWIAGKLGNRASALVTGLLLLAAIVSNLAMLPYPIWFKIANLVAIPSAIVAGVYLARRRPQAAPPIAA